MIGEGAPYKRIALLMIETSAIFEGCWPSGCNVVISLTYSCYIEYEYTELDAEQHEFRNGEYVQRRDSQTSKPERQYSDPLSQVLGICHRPQRGTSCMLVNPLLGTAGNVISVLHRHTLGLSIISD